MRHFLPDQNDISRNVTAALSEDIGSGDISAELLHPQQEASATIICREKAILCGIAWVNEVYAQLDKRIQIQWLYNDGDLLTPGSRICIIKGSVKNILSGERSAINFLQTLSATATQTNKIVGLIQQTQTKILDTRKTIPGLRHAQKYAVRCGGGLNHRMGLYDAFLIKENHIFAAGSITNAIDKARKMYPGKLLEIEVENLEELEEAIRAKPDRVLLDNFETSQLRLAVALVNGACELEASGGIIEKNILEIAHSGVDFISLGMLTKDIKAIDFSMRLE